MQTCPHSGLLGVGTRPLVDIVFRPTDCEHTADHQTEMAVPSTGSETVKHHKWFKYLFFNACQLICVLTVAIKLLDSCI